MRDSLLRTLIVLMALLLGAVVVLIGLVLKGEDAADSVTATTVALDPGAGGETTAPNGSDGVEPDDPDIPVVTLEDGLSGGPEADPEDDEESPPGDLLVPAPPEVWRETYTMEVGDYIDIPVPSHTALTQIQLQEVGFSLNKEWWFVGTRYAGPEGCRDSTRSAPGQPVRLDVLAVTEGWYACIDIDRFARFGQMHFLAVDPVGQVEVEVIIWDFAAFGDEGA